MSSVSGATQTSVLRKLTTRSRENVSPSQLRCAITQSPQDLKRDGLGGSVAGGGSRVAEVLRGVSAMFLTRQDKRKKVKGKNHLWLARNFSLFPFAVFLPHPSYVDPHAAAL